MKTRRIVFLWGFVAFASAILAQTPGTFTPAGNMRTARGGHTATLLLNGKVLIAGGYQDGFPESDLASAELYDPATRTFGPTGDMTVPRVGHSATLLPDGRVLIAGGGSSVHPYASAELYDPSTGTFSAAGDMMNPHRFHTATLLGNGKVLIAGNASSAERYDPASDSFALAGAYAEIGPVFMDTATLLPNGKVLVTGYDSSFAAPKTELYDPRTDTFSLAGTTTGPVNWWWEDVNTATLLMNGNVLIAGEEENDGTPAIVEMYDPSGAIFTTFGNTIEPHDFATATLLPDGTVLIAGGEVPGGNGSAWAELYSPASGRFSLAPGMTPRGVHTATLLRDGTVLIAGGFSFWPLPTASADIYTPPTPQAAPVLLSLSGDGQGQGAIQHAGTTRIASATDPAVPGEYLSIYLNGLVDGSVIPPQVAIGGRLAEITFFGDVPGTPGLNVVNVRMPSSVAPGPAVPVRLTYLGRPSNQVTIGVSEVALQQAIAAMKTAAGTDSLNFWQWAYYWQYLPAFSGAPTGFGVVGSVSPNVMEQIITAGGGDPFQNVSAEQWVSYFRQVVPI